VIKGKISVKSIIVMLILLLVVALGVLGMGTAKTYFSSASADSEPEGVKAVADGKQIRITWTTKTATKGYIEYGTSTAAMLIRTDPEEESTSDHSVLIDSFKSNVAYYFRIRQGDEIAKKSEWEVFDNGGIPFMFNVKSDSMAMPSLTPAPTMVVRVTPTAETSACDRKTDYNKDGVVNSLDYMECVKGKVVVPTVGNDPCPGGVDYNKDGVTNSLDRIKCLQDRNL